MKRRDELEAFTKWCNETNYDERTPFDAWCEAKRQAEESAKPTVKIFPSINAKTSYPFVLSLFEGETFNGILEDFRTEEDAKNWAVANGYRVIK